jgi:DNA primase
VFEARPLLTQIPPGVLKVQIEHEFARQMRLTPEELTHMLAQPARPGLPGARPPAAAVEPSLLVDNAGAPGGGGAPPPRYPPEGRAPARRDANRSRRVTPMAKRLLRLLCLHPELVDKLSEQQLEILEHSPHLDLVRQLIGVIGMTEARHIGGLLQAAPPGSELEAALQSLRETLLAEEALPAPLAEWNDAVQQVEIESIKAEQSALIASGMSSEAERQRYQILARRLAHVTRARMR